MGYSNLVSYIKLSPNCTKPRNHVVDTITIHCAAGNIYVESLGTMFANPKLQVSSNYGIDSKGKIGLFVDESNRSWCSSNAANDHRAITIEVANDSGGPEWHVSAAAMDSLIKLCADICKRHNIKKLLWQADKSLIGKVDKQNMTVHRWFANKSCPGDYLYRNMGKIAEEVNKLLGNTPAPVPSTPTLSPTPATTSLKFKTGDIVNFTGSKQYPSSTSATGVPCKPDKAKITAVAPTAKHPYHVIGQSHASSVYGWVDAADVTAITTKTIEEIAQEVISGKWGNGTERTNKLKAAGYDPAAVQAKVNQLLKK